MRGKNNNNKKRSPRRRRNPNGSTVARNQTKYHRQYIGFETTLVLGTVSAGAGIALPIAPGVYPSTSSASSLNFVERFVQCWKGWRMLGWKCTVMNADASSGKTLAAVPFNQSLTAITGPSTALAYIKPTSTAQLCELPNIKMLSADAANSKNRASFSYFQGRRDINSLPFQWIVEDLPLDYITGIQMYADTQTTIRVFGNMLIEFKDPAFYVSPGPMIDNHDFEEVDQPSPVSSQIKRLQRVDLTKQ